ncbi:amidohydrolase family protein [Chloroflexota bacterium]
MKIDIYAHILPETYFAAFRKKNKTVLADVYTVAPYVINLQDRLRLMERYPDVLQVISVMQPPLDGFVEPADAVELARIANDEVAELVAKYPDKFAAGVACLPMNDMDATLEEADRAIKQLGLKGVQIYSRVNGETVDSPQLRPLYEKMAAYDLPIWIHPLGRHFRPGAPRGLPDDGVFDLLFETSYAMQRLVLSGIFREFPNIKFIVHHSGAMIPLVENRFPHIEQFRNFYGDTATYGATPPLMLAHTFFGADHLLFATDSPLGPKFGCTLDVVHAVERMDVPEADKEKIFLRNATKLMKLAI